MGPRAPLSLGSPSVKQGSESPCAHRGCEVSKGQAQGKVADRALQTWGCLCEPPCTVNCPPSRSRSLFGKFKHPRCPLCLSQDRSLEVGALSPTIFVCSGCLRGPRSLGGLQTTETCFSWSPGLGGPSAGRVSDEGPLPGPQMAASSLRPHLTEGARTCLGSPWLGHLLPP